MQETVTFYVNGWPLDSQVLLFSVNPWINAGYLTDNRLPVNPDINLITQDIRHIFS